MSDILISHYFGAAGFFGGIAGCPFGVGHTSGELKEALVEAKIQQISSRSNFTTVRESEVVVSGEA
jgi:hypothetical protein